MSEPLKVVEEGILRGQGALYEGDVFAVLKQSPFIARSFEFALADGAIDCSRAYHRNSQYADRYWDLYQRQYLEPSELLLFDVKSTVAGEAGEQGYISTIRQRRHVAFYIGIVAADPTFVEIIPNYHQETAALAEVSTAYTSDKEANRNYLVNYTRTCPLPPSSYGGLDQCGTPYRLPLCMLKEAIARIRQCVLSQAEQHYVNPWTGVEFADWQPKTTTQAKFLRPADDSDHATAYEAAIEIYRVLKHDERSTIKPDFVGLQPRLADIKLYDEIDKRQVLVQHKLDTRVRAMNSALTKVLISRNDGEDQTYYFSSSDRFDFLWIQFTFSKGLPEVQYVTYLIPECMLPDEFFTTTNKETDFTRYPEFDDYRIEMDQDGDWLLAVEHIIRSNRAPRKPGARPMRARLDESEKKKKAVDPEIKANAAHGRHLFREMLQITHRRFYYGVMRECAQRKSGLIITLATNHPMGDFAYCRYSWSCEDQVRFLQRGIPPKAGHHMPSAAEIVPTYVYSQHAESSFQGPNLRASHFRRLNSCQNRRLILWDIGGPDTIDRPLPLLAIPSEDISPERSQIKLLETNLKKSEEKKSPNLSALLNKGLFASEYRLQHGIHCQSSYHRSHYDDLWEFLDHIATIDDFEHPPNHKREAGTYRHTMKWINQRLIEQQRHGLDMNDDLE